MREVQYGEVVVVSGTGNTIAVVAPTFLKSSEPTSRGLLELVEVTLIGASSTPTTMTCAVYVEDHVQAGRITADAAYSATATPAQFIVDSVTGLAIVEDVSSVACAPNPLASFGGGTVIKILPTGLGGSDAWVCHVNVRARRWVN